jgi:uncharacterized protein (TIGR03118 family)
MPYLSRRWMALWILLEIFAAFGPRRAFARSGYIGVNLVSDLAGEAEHTDTNLVNPWGLFVGAAHLWVANNGSGVVTVYEGDGSPDPLVISVPQAPTGLVENDSRRFVIQAHGGAAPAVLLFATEAGTISGWSPRVDKNAAVLAVDHSPTRAVYKGIAIGQDRGETFLFAADFHNNRVEVLDGGFKSMASFTDPHLPPGFAPFGIENVGGHLVVTYALREEGGDGEVPGAGNGFVDIFSTRGKLLRRFASRGALNAPWGIALAPSGFGRFSNALLIGNSGDGRINAFDPQSGDFLGQLRDARTLQIISIPGLRALGSRPDAHGGGSRLYFTAGAGLFGYLRPGKRFR